MRVIYALLFVSAIVIPTVSVARPVDLPLKSPQGLPSNVKDSFEFPEGFCRSKIGLVTLSGTKRLYDVGLATVAIRACSLNDPARCTQLSVEFIADMSRGDMPKPNTVNAPFLSNKILTCEAGPAVFYTEACKAPSKYATAIHCKRICFTLGKTSLCGSLDVHLSADPSENSAQR